MTILDNLRAASTDALKAGDKNMRTLTGVLIGDMEMAACKSASGKISDEECLTIIKKLIKSNKEMISHNAKNSDVLQQEIDVLTHLYIPASVSLEEISLTFAGEEDKISSMNFGQAVGYCMKTLKGKGHAVEASDVQTYIKGIQ